MFGILTLIGAVVGIIVTLFNGDSFWQGLVVLAIGTPVALFLATWVIGGDEARSHRDRSPSECKRLARRRRSARNGRERGAPEPTESL